MNISKLFFEGATTDFMRSLEVGKVQVNYAEISFATEEKRMVVTDQSTKVLRTNWDTKA